MELYQRNTETLGNGRQASMERLNDIMMRTVQHRQGIQEQRSTQRGEDSPPQRSKSQLARRPPLPEQTARLGQQTSYAPPQPQPQPQPHNRHIQNNPQVGSGNRGEQGARYPQQRANGQTLRQREIDRRSPVYYQRSQRRVQEQEPQYFVSGQGQEEAKTTSDYYTAYPVMPPADVQEDWEDDAESMRYGDWETEASNDLHRFSPTDAGVTYAAPVVPQDASWSAARVLPRQQVSSPLTVRELSERAVREPEPRSPLTRNLREARMTQVQALPLPQAPTQEVQGYHRNTQPLNPRKMAGMNQHIPQDVPHPAHPAQQPAHQANVRNQTTHPAPPSSYGPCPICKGAGYLRAEVPYGHPNFGKPIACECKEAERAEKRRLQLRTMSNLDAFSDKSFRNFNPRVPGVQEAFEVAQAYAYNPDGWLVLIGRNGCGKTHLAAAIANQHLVQGSLVLFATVPDLLDHLRATFAPTSPVVYDQLFSSMREAELLVLDDLGSEQNSPWASEKLFQLLNYRYNSRFPTVITTNSMRLQTVDERIRSRLMDRSLVIEVTMDRAQDYRPHNPRRE
jgi:DNA replication protein DnaC